MTIGYAIPSLASTCQQEAGSTIGFCAVTGHSRRGVDGCSFRAAWELLRSSFNAHGGEWLADCGAVNLGRPRRLSALSPLAVAAQLLALARLRNAAPVICAIQESLKGDGGLPTAAGQRPANWMAAVLLRNSLSDVAPCAGARSRLRTTATACCRRDPAIRYRAIAVQGTATVFSPRRTISLPA